MKLLLDQNLSADAAMILRSRGMDAIHARETGLETAEDGAILDWCRTEERVIITLDADFHALLALAGARTPSVVRIRIEGLRDEALAALIGRVIAHAEADLRHGAVVTVTETSIRVRRLPLVSPGPGDGDDPAGR
jgi:predicted nuclease of predicted toxin-antitoxin system